MKKGEKIRDLTETERELADHYRGLVERRAAECQRAENAHRLAAERLAEAREYLNNLAIAFRGAGPVVLEGGAIYDVEGVADA